MPFAQRLYSSVAFWLVSSGGWASLVLICWIPVVLAIFLRSPIAGTVLAAGTFFSVWAAYQPALFMVGIFATMPYQQSFGGEQSSINISVSDCIAAVLAFALPVICMRRGKMLVGPIAVPLVFFLGIATLSSAMNLEGIGTGVSLARMYVGTLIAVLIFANGDMHLKTAHRCFTIYLVSTCVLGVFSIIAFLQGGVQGSMYTLGIHKNALGPTYGVGIVIALGALLMEKVTGKRRAFLLVSLGLATIGIVLSLSRGGWVATGIGVLVLLVLSRNVRAFVISLTVLIPAIALIWRSLPEEATEYASDVSSKAHTIQTRVEVINMVMKEYERSPIIGVGIGLRKTMEPHNVVILTLGEVGSLGLCAFIGTFVGGFYTFVLAARWSRENAQARQIALTGACVLLVSITHGLMDVYWRRGVGFAGWSCVGMAANIIWMGRTGQLYPIHAASQQPDAYRAAALLSSGQADAA